MSLASSIVILNGQVMPQQQALTFWKHSGVKVGWGFFETLRAQAGHPEALALHHARLTASCTAFRLLPPTLEQFTEHLAQALELAQLQDGLARLRWTTLSYSPETGQSYQVIEAEPLQSYPEEAHLYLLPHPTPSRGPLVGHKSLSYGAHAWGLQEAKSHGADEGLWINDKHDVTEACTSNLFWWKAGTLHTPALSTGCLPGTMRHLVIQWARENSIPVMETVAPLQALLEADDVFLTSSLRGVQSVKSLQTANSRVQWEKSHDTSAIKQDLLQLIESQCLAQTKNTSNKFTYFASQAPAEHV